MHAFLAERTKNGKAYFELVCCDPYLCDFFEHWSFELSKKHKYRTVKSYSGAACILIQYLFEVRKQYGDFDNISLFDALDSFESYLAYGRKSDSKVASSVAKVLGDKNLGGSSISTYFAGINNFLEKNEKLRLDMLHLEKSGFLSPSNLSQTSMAAFNKINTPQYTKKALKESSWLAGCIAGGMRKIKKKNLVPTIKPSLIIHTDTYGGDEKTFPIDLCKKLIKSANNLRDKLLWSLIAATGCRVSEAQTMLREDIKITVEKVIVNGKEKFNVKKSISIIDPATRVNLLNKYLTESEINSLPHKGRETTETYLIEPFASMFWLYYDEYTKQEKAKDKKRGVFISHPFIFRQVRTGKHILHSYQSLWESISAKAIDLTGQSYGFHSLRHMYSYYLRNFAPNPKGGFGLSLKTLQGLLGHAEIKSTQRYGRKDAIKLAAAIGALNMMRNNTPHFSIINAKIKYLQAEIAILESEVETQKRELPSHD